MKAMILLFIHTMPALTQYLILCRMKEADQAEAPHVRQGTLVLDGVIAATDSRPENVMFRVLDVLLSGPDLQHQ